MNSRFPGTKIVQPGSGRLCHRAKWIVAGSDRIIENGYIRLENGIITEVSASSAPAGSVDHGDGVLIPPLINAHTHLDLSLFKECCHTESGFEHWVRQIIALKESADPDEIGKEAGKAVSKMAESGTLYTGDICSNGFYEQFPVKGTPRSLAGGVRFREFLGTLESAGTGIELTGIPFSGDDLLEWKGSFACHAPHTCSPGLLKTVKQKAKENKLPFSIHLAESAQEAEFITTAKGKWAELLTERGIDFSDWGLPAESPVVHAHSLGLLDHGTLAVHLLQISNEDLDIIADSGAKACLCPRSNMNLHGRMPELFRMIQKGIQPAIGTDSLASCDTLSVLDEMSFIALHLPGISPEILLNMATIYGARALGIEKTAGELDVGKPGWMVYLPVTASNSTALLEKITGYESI